MGTNYINFSFICARKIMSIIYKKNNGVFIVFDFDYLKLNSSNKTKRFIYKLSILILVIICQKK